ncbi:MAG: ABC transporter ATP-binding protein [Anaerolineae bacterium]|nr:ABC transporter ATP-binding protein [Anaerolineae bacterium]
MISIQNFSFRFRGSARDALREVNLNIATGDFVVLTGPSGCGKSTLALALGGFLFNQYDGEADGSITVAGMDVRHTPIYDVAEVVGLVQQNPESQFCTLSVRDEVAFGLENRCLPRAEIQERLTWALDVVGARHLEERALATLSGGEKQRVAVAAIMASRPQVLVFDEPTSNLDPTATAQIFDVIARIRDLDGITVIVIEHKTAYLERFTPRWVRMESGRIYADAGQDAGQDAGRNAGRNAPLSQSPPHNRSTTPLGANLRPIPSAPEPLLRIEGLCTGYNDVTVLHDVSLTAGPGEFIGVMGDNGSGKSTFLQCLLGLLRPMAGKIEVLGRDAGRAPVSQLARQIAYVFQNPNHQLFADSVWQEATLAPRNFGVWDNSIEQHIEAMLQLSGLDDRRDDHPYRLSYGEKRRLNLLAMLSYAPRLLLLDEILIGQDPQNAARLLQWVATCVAAGNTAILVHHAPAVVRHYAHRLLFFEQGRLLIDAPSEEGFAQLKEMGKTAYLTVSDGESL